MSDNVSTRVLDEEATRNALPFDALIPRLRDMFRTGCEVPARHVHKVKTGEAEGTVLIMPAWTDRYLGIKTVNIYPGNARLGLPGLFAAYNLFDARTGRTLASIDGDVITSRRTAAASALAASYLARKDSRRLLVVGAGRVGSLVPRAYSEVFDLQEIWIWAREQKKASALAAELRAEGLPASTVEDLESAVREADIVSTATLATAPVVSGRWLKSNGHLDLIGSFTPQMRETDDDAFRASSVFVDTEEALAKSGDLLGPLATGAFHRERLAGSLADLCAGRSPGRVERECRTVFKSVGTALEDLAAAIQVYEHWMVNAQ
jgi:ornithine cyclodeaminase